MHTTRTGSQTNSDTRYLLTDHLGSVDAIADENGNLVERHSFDEFGQHRDEYWNTVIGSVTAAITTRGYTGHEQLDNVGLIHMNGRVYDPLLGRFLSADPHIQFPNNLQSHNRYTYVNNNPLSYTDPSGFFIGGLFKSLAKAIRNLVRKVVRAIKNFISKYGRTLAAIAIVTFAPQATFLQSFAAGFGAGLVASGGDIKAALIGGLSFAVIQPVAHQIFNSAPTSFPAAGGGAGVGSFGHAGAAGIAQSGTVGGLSLPGLGEIAANAVARGTTSVLSGGKFVNGAKTGAFNTATSLKIDGVDPIIKNVVLPAEEYTPYEVYPTMAETLFTNYHGNIDDYFVAAALGSRKSSAGPSSIATGRVSGYTSTERLRIRKSAYNIANGHAFEKHVVNKGEFNAFVKTRRDFMNHIDRIISNPSATRQLSRGRTAYWDNSSNTVVIRNPNSRDGGTAFQPPNGKGIF